MSDIDISMQNKKPKGKNTVAVIPKADFLEKNKTKSRWLEGVIRIPRREIVDCGILMQMILQSSFRSGAITYYKLLGGVFKGMSVRYAHHRRFRSGRSTVHLQIVFTPPCYL